MLGIVRFCRCYSSSPLAAVLASTTPCTAARTAAVAAASSVPRTYTVCSLLCLFMHASGFHGLILLVVADRWGATPRFSLTIQATIILLPNVFQASHLRHRCTTIPHVEHDIVRMIDTSAHAYHPYPCNPQSVVADERSYKHDNFIEAVVVMERTH